MQQAAAFTDNKSHRRLA